ncbi:NAD(P)-binding domain-containing protein [Desulforhopalus singaporensis]|uniref:Pyrroline-5-carboxylate reductase n=1 Tax=Desulforhopalus singaporensis TaxID=91360 RepID=A0A1H0VVK1_9BACT|nr:NAD(P)-binding domain-containing protein [Desulforhopalus singaporensis]SDP82589.1 pyrroline-5-carboxylate reductase [Desulforhopalus singaporensis]
MNLGFIGVGNIGKAIITGLCTCPTPPGKILIYDVDEAKCLSIAKHHKQVEIALDNQDLLDRVDCVFLCVIPQIAPQVLLPLNFREDLLVISVIAIRPTKEIGEYVAPAKILIRAVPLPSIAYQVGPLIYYPDNDTVAELFARTARAIPVESESDLIILSAITGLIAPYYSLVNALSGWAASAGIDKDIAIQYTLGMFDVLNYQAMKHEATLDELSAEAATFGGLNDQALRELKRHKAFDPFVNALDLLLQRLGLEANQR